jgi:antitoxin component YwqK of YwqJK toxin-antitoxin module
MKKLNKKKYIKIRGFNSIYVKYKYLIDIRNMKQVGEYIDYHLNGSVRLHGFHKKDELIGAAYMYKEDGNLSEVEFYSFKIPGQKITEIEHKKQLAKLRLGLIRVPELKYFLKDYE